MLVQRVDHLARCSNFSLHPAPIVASLFTFYTDYVAAEIFYFIFIANFDALSFKTMRRLSLCDWLTNVRVLSQSQRMEK